MGANPLFAGSHKVKSQKPFVQRNMRTFKQCSNRYREMLAATVALVKTWAMAFALKFGDLLSFTAMRA